MPGLFLLETTHLIPFVTLRPDEIALRSKPVPFRQRKLGFHCQAPISRAEEGAAPSGRW